MRWWAHREVVGWVVVCAAWVGCGSDESTICNRVVACLGSPCAINQCRQRLEGFDPETLAMTAACFEGSSCRAIQGGECPGEAAVAAQRCCVGTPAKGCDLAACRDVPADAPWPPQCLGDTPSAMVCEWVDQCELVSSVDVPAVLSENPDPGCDPFDDVGNRLSSRDDHGAFVFCEDRCRALAAGLDAPERVVEAADCRQCIRGTMCENTKDGGMDLGPAQCAPRCGVTLLEP